MAMSIQCLSCSRFLAVAGGRSIPLQRKPLLCSVSLSSRSRNLSSSIVAASSKKKNKQNRTLSQTHVTEGDGDGDGVEEEDAFELLFKQLEEDLKNDDLLDDDSGDEITEEDVAIFERELADALGDYDAQLLNSDTQEAANDPENGTDDGDESSLKLRTWQMKKLARALKAGRRKTNIKNLAAELCLDRALVLELLRNPPPNLLMMSLSIPDEPTPTVISPETKLTETVHKDKETSTDLAESGPKAKVPIHTMQNSWSAQKRLKKAHVDTLERVYRRSKRPTNAMISNIVHVTNIPRRRVIKWFEDKRAEEGVPDHRLPYQRSVYETD